MTELKVLAEQLVNLTVKQANELSDILKNEYGIEPAASAPMMMAAGPAAPTEAVAEKTTFDVVVKSAGASKLAVVKLIKEITGLNLKEAKEFVDGVPGTMKENLPKEEAETIKRKLEEAGAEVELK
ncbi:MAG: 50S ribosomal protein L7/L12 [Candidatus Cardinium sp.]|uniref:50S ribosomal protein L7/L12 n=1 Tax=Cardinium endosymbiont of Dermatophagoides farinae TaxID=2597823 RepID=UPI001183342C|nr:50S ribosomal protein L7/L12 [Cardinium endosymbiont of Dermatophagoides farinae]TSJ80519.1 50S ribosomal protein L7/L12 [Cardinium endosymbiont of Dermatophagoides farinae]UWW96485.1 MAG: 50S ribosomal protein L7/L12 [Candidatus Cardinium sp.]